MSKETDAKARYNELAKHLDNIDEGKRGFILSLLSDFVFAEQQIEKLRALPRFIVDPHDPRKQKKLPAHDMLKDFQAQKNDIAVKILRSLDGEVGEESALVKALAHFNNE